MSRTKTVPKDRPTSSPHAKDDKNLERRPGRPPTSKKGGINRQKVLQHALRHAKSRALQELSILTLAKSMGVAPTLIHYYVGGRAWLTSGVMNLFYRNLVKRWPRETGDWQTGLVASARLIFDQVSAYPGIAAYLVTNDRFRTYQLTAFGDRDFGLEVLERFTTRVRAAGLSSERTGIYSYLLMDFVVSTAYASSHHIFPSDHRKFLQQKFDELDPAKFPSIFFAQRAPLAFDGKAAFNEGIRLFLLGLNQEIAESKTKTPPDVAKGVVRKPKRRVAGS